MAGTNNAGQKLLERNGHILLHWRIKGTNIAALVTVQATINRLCFSKIGQQKLTTATVSGGITNHFLKEPFCRSLFLFAFIFHKKTNLSDVGSTVQKQCVGQFAVTPRTTNFLIILLQAPWQIIVNHKPHVGLVDSHAKGHGGHHNLHLIPNKKILMVNANLICQACMIRQHVVARLLQLLSQLFHLFARQTIDDATFVLVGF